MSFFKKCTCFAWYLLVPFSADLGSEVPQTARIKVVFSPRTLYTKYTEKRSHQSDFGRQRWPKCAKWPLKAGGWRALVRQID